MTISFADILLEGTALSAALTLIILGSLAWNPRMWHTRAPAAVQAQHPPLTDGEKRQQKLVAAALFGTVALVMLWSSARVQAQHGGEAPFVALFVSLLGVLMIFNLVDLLLIDYLLLTILKPSFMHITFEIEHPYAFHFRGFLKGCVILSVLSASAAALVAGINMLM
jgi:hypothetical protein